MTKSTLALSDSISLSVISTDKFKSDLLTITLTSPLSAKSSVYNMLLTGILKRGTKSYPSIALLNRRLDELYASSVDARSARLGKNLTLTVTADMLNESYIPDGTDVFGGVLEIIYETLFCPKLEDGLFLPSVFEQEKSFMLDNINASVNNTRLYASIRLAEMMLSHDAEFPTLEETKNILNGISNESLVSYLSELVSSSSVNIFYIGRNDTSTVIKRLKPLTDRLAKRSNAKIAAPYAETLLPLRSVTEKMPVNQGKLAMGFKLGIVNDNGKKEHYAAILLNEIFGGSPASKLFLNVREKRSLCYYCSSSYNQYMGTLTVSSGIENSNRKIAEEAILTELWEIQNGNISDIEFHAAKISLENSYRQIYDSPYDLQSFYGNRAILGINESIEDARDGIFAITRDDVIKVAKKAKLDSIFFVEGTEKGEKCDYEQ